MSDYSTHLALQPNQLLPERRIFRFKSAVGLDESCQQVEGQEDQRDHPRKRDVIPSPVQCGRGFQYEPRSSRRSDLLGPAGGGALTPNGRPRSPPGVAQDHDLAKSLMRSARSPSIS
jgi:hypothetical protein